MSQKSVFKIILFCILLTYCTPAAASGEILISKDTINMKFSSADSLEANEIFSGIDISDLLTSGKEKEIQQYVEKQAESKVFENGLYKYSVHEKKKLQITRTADSGIRVKGSIRTYTTLERLAPRCPQPVLDLFHNKSGFQLKIDENAEKTCQIDSKKKTVTLKKPTPQIYRALGLVYYKTEGIERSKSWRIKCGQEAEQAKTTLSNFFACAFYEYCANPSNLRKKYPNTYTFINNKFRQ